MTPSQPLLAEALFQCLPSVRGRILVNAGLAATTWFKVGGLADVLFRPIDTDDLARFLRNLPANVSLTVLGVASNTLIRDGGIRGVVIRLGRGFTEVIEDGDDGIIAGAAALCATVAQTSARAGLGGLPFLSGIPGTVGGALAMNAGAYGSEIADVLDWAETLDTHGKVQHLTPQDLHYAYRHSELPERWIFTRARFRGTPGEKGITEEILRIAKSRAKSQPLGSATGGSTFHNPPGEKAWQLIDAVGGRGMRIGGAKMSVKHCNFMLNIGGATALDLETLGETLRARVLAATGILLQWEIKRIGELLEGQSLPA